MIDHLSPVVVNLLLAGSLVAGFALGLAYFALMKRSVEAHVAGEGWLLPASLTVGRLAAIAIVLVAASRFGAGPLLAVFGGFLAARIFVLRRVRRGVAG